MYPAHKQVPLLLESLENRGLPSLRKFLEVLKETGHSYLVETILDTEAIPVSDVRPETTQSRSGESQPPNRRRPYPSATSGRRPRSHGQVSHSYLVETTLDTEAIPVSDVRPETTQSRSGESQVPGGVRPYLYCQRRQSRDHAVTVR